MKKSFEFQLQQKTNRIEIDLIEELCFTGTISLKLFCLTILLVYVNLKNRKDILPLLFRILNTIDN